MSRSKIRVLCADDDPGTNALHSLVLGDEPDIEVVGSVCRIEEVLPALDALAADLVLLDLRMGADDPLPLLRELAGRTPAVRALVLSGYEDPGLIEELLAAGASGFVAKAVDVDSIAPAMREVMRGGRPIVRLRGSS